MRPFLTYKNKLEVPPRRWRPFHVIKETKNNYTMTFFFDKTFFFACHTCRTPYFHVIMQVLFIRVFMTSFQSSRITALDGLRGLAIILVILNHFYLQKLYEAVPQQFHLVLETITSNGKIGVGILFMLSGFLMMKVYPQINSTLAFYQKRYTRIFPALVCMCLSLAIVRYFGQDISVRSILIILVIHIVVGGIFWRYIQHLSQRKKLGTGLFLMFFISQILVTIGYIALAMKVQPAVFYEVWPNWIRSVIYFFVNATLTLPFGIYVPQLDGVYWSLVTEVFFYLMYPVLFLPIFNVLKASRIRAIKIVFLITTFLFFIGIALLAQNILGFQMMQLQFSMYFISGMLIAGYEEKLLSFKTKYISIQQPNIIFAIAVILLLGKPFFHFIIPRDIIIDNIIWVIPTSLAFILALKTDNNWHAFLTNRFLVTLGQYSYSLYLTHSIAIELFIRNGEPNNLYQMIVAILLSIPVMIFLSIILHHALEKPYFFKIKQNAIKNDIKKHFHQNQFTPQKVVFFSAILLSLLWYGFHEPLSLKAYSQSHNANKEQKHILITTTPVTFEFLSENNNLGLLLFHLKPLTDAEIKQRNIARGSNDDVSLEITILEKDAVVSKNTFALNILTESRFHPTGLPLITDSKGKTYIVVLRLTGDNSSQLLSLVNDSFTFKSVYFYSARDLLQPHTLYKHITHKLTQPFTDNASHRIGLYLLPSILVLFYITVQSQTKKL